LQYYKIGIKIIRPIYTVKNLYNLLYTGSTHINEKTREYEHLTLHVYPIYKIKYIP